MVVDHFPSCLLELLQVCPDGIERAGILLHALNYPTAEGVDGDVIEGEVCAIYFVQELGNPFGADVGDGGDFVLACGIGVGACGVGRGVCAGLESNVEVADLAVVRTVLDREEDGDVLLGGGAVGRGSGGAHHAGDGTERG